MSTTAKAYNGLLNVHKEAGWTSNDVVVKLRGVLHQKKIGHTGTLDPDATGVLVAVLGSATKLASLLDGQEKEYIAVCKLGCTTDTEDIGGRILSTTSVRIASRQEEARDEAGAVILSRDRIRACVQSFQGDYAQRPPMYSAVKVGGQRLYKLARQGISVAREKRNVHISSIRVLDMSSLSADLTFTMEVRCSKGTYIRTLCADIGEALGTGACMAHLTRTAVGSFRLEEAKSLAEIESLARSGALHEAVVAPDVLFRDCDRVVAKDEALHALRNGNPLPLALMHADLPQDADDREEAEKLYAQGALVRLYDREGCFYGIYEYDARKRVFAVQRFLYQQDA